MYTNPFSGRCLWSDISGWLARHVRPSCFSVVRHIRPIYLYTVSQSVAGAYDLSKTEGSDAPDLSISQWLVRHVRPSSGHRHLPLTETLFIFLRTYITTESPYSNADQASAKKLTSSLALAVREDRWSKTKRSLSGISRMRNFA